MGVPDKARSVRMNDEDVRMTDEVQDMLSPMCESRSSAIRWMIRFSHTALSMPEILQKVEQAFQDASCNLFVRRMSHTNSLSAAKPGPQKLTSLKGERERRPGVISHQFTATVLAATLVRQGARKSPPVWRGIAGRSVA